MNSNSNDFKIKSVYSGSSSLYFSEGTIYGINAYPLNSNYETPIISVRKSSSTYIIQIACLSYNGGFTIISGFTADILYI